MANVLKQLLEGRFTVEEFQNYLKTGNILITPSDPEPATLVTEFVPYFLNFIREESSHHFASDLPVISPKKIKKRKKPSQSRTPRSNNTSNESSRSSAKASLFSTLSKLENSNISPVGAAGQKESHMSPTSPAIKQQQSSYCSPTDDSRLKSNSIVTSTPMKFNLEDDFPPPSLSAQKESKRKSSTPTRRITPTPARASYARRSSATAFNNSNFENTQDSDTSFSSDPSALSEKSGKYRQKFGNVKTSVGNSGSPKTSRKNNRKFKLEDFMQKGLPNRKTSGTSQQLDSSNLNTSSEFDNSNSFEFPPNESQMVRKDGSQSENSFTFAPSIKAKKDEVTEVHILECLANAHSFCITENLVPNIVVELCFVLQLLTIRGNENTENGFNSKYLTTVHNCVYYAVIVLEKVTRLLKLLDKGTLHLLLDNQRLTEFSTTLIKELNEVYPTIASNKIPYSLIKSPLNSVPFQATVDNRNNFSTDQAFHCFKRQRDTFYEIVRGWEECRGKPGWSLDEKLGNKIRFVVHQKPGLSNHSHFARLFQSQLIQMCCYENSLPTFNEGESPEIIGNLLKSNPEKLFRLQQRLVAPLSTNIGPCPPPGFTETEEFFREFIMSAMSPSFNRYLMDSLMAKIIELNNLDVPESLEKSTPTADPDKNEEYAKFQVKFATCVITLRTVAKFLGFLVFSPYHSSTELPLAVKDNSITVRNQVAEQLDIMSYLKKAEKDHRLVLTLPWVVEYLSMIDSVGPHLKYYKKVFEFLHHIYKEILPQKFTSDMNRNALMLSMGLGWLFEIPTIPETLFSKSSAKTVVESAGDNPCANLDNMDLVDQQLLYTCCPYLGELRSILAEAVIGRTARRGSVKKIKPICADKTEASSSPKSRLLQAQLEDNFFRNQPEFLKRIVDFSISRIYHNLVAFVKKSIVPSETKDAKTKLNIHSVLTQGDLMELNKEDFKEKNRGLVLRLSNKTTDETFQKITSDVDRQCKTRSCDSVRSLSPFDMDEVVIKTTAGIVHQSTMDKLMEWAHQNLPGFIEKQIEQDIDKILTQQYNSPLNGYRAQAQDPDNSFNWFYQQLVEKAEKTDAVTTTEEKDLTEHGKITKNTETTPHIDNCAQEKAKDCKSNISTYAQNTDSINVE